MINFFMGLAFGVPFGFSFGPVFFTITESSLKRGFWSGVIVSIGILVSDLIFMIGILIGLGRYFEGESAQTVMSLVGAIFLLGFGITFLKKKIDLNPDKPIGVSKNHMGSFMKGFLVNTLNPYVAVFWTGVIASAITELNLEGRQLHLYLAGFVSNLLIADLLKAYLAEYLRDRLSQKMNWIYKGIGLIFIGFGIKLLIDFLISL